MQDIIPALEDRDQVMAPGQAARPDAYEESRE